MQQNYQSYESLQNSNNSLDIDPTIKILRPKTVNTNEQSSEKRSFNRTSISSKNKSKENDSYNNFISRIKLNYNLLHPKQRIQTIIFHYLDYYYSYFGLKKDYFHIYMNKNYYYNF